jgi:Transcriptional repressor TCF25
LPLYNLSSFAYSYTAYNISLLLQVSKIAKDQGDHALSSDLIERALFSFARATTSLFANKLSQGKARLNFARPENRELWLAGWQYIKSLQMKGTYRTALEWAKLLLSMSPEQDPYCMLLVIHHLALRAFEAQYLLEIYDVAMPKIANKLASNFVAPSLALAAIQLRDGQKARSLLQHSIQHQPWLFRRLFQELSLDNAPPSIWGAEPRTDAENLLSDLYVYQTKDLWNTPEATSLLMEVAHATERLQDDVIPKIQNSEITLDIARFIYLDNTPALMALVPSKLLHRIPNSDSDPLPPDHNVFSWESQRKPWIANERRSDPGSYLTDFINPLAAIRDMFPALGRALTEDEDEPGLVELREAMEQNMEMEESAATARDSEAAPTGSLRRMYEIIFGARRHASETQGTEDSESSNHDDSDTSDEAEVYEDAPSQ